MEKNEVREFQLKQLVLLDEIDSVCKELNLKYYIIAGTLLGAVRHGGFIPWDFDLDIAMPRQDYKILKDYYLFNKSEYFFYEDYDTEKYHNTTHAMLRLKKTHLINARLISVDKKIKYNGCLLDIFPLDNAPNDEALQEKQIKRINRIKKIFYYKEAQVFENTSFFKKAIKRIISFFLIVCTYKFLGKKLEKIETMYNDCDSKYLVSMSSHYSYKKQLMEKDIYGIPKRISFEDREYNCPAQVDIYLKRLYGDYMKLPPEEGRYDGLKEITFIDER